MAYISIAADFTGLARWAENERYVDTQNLMFLFYNDNPLHNNKSI